MPLEESGDVLCRYSANIFTSGGYSAEKLFIVIELPHHPWLAGSDAVC
jgi:hypothetical protein